MPIFAPAEIDSEPFDPLRLVTTLVAAGAGTDSVTVPPEAFVVPDIDRLPATLQRILLPEKAVALESAAVVVFPLKLIPVKLDVPLYEIVIELAPTPRLIPPAEDRETLLEVPLRLKFVAAGTLAEIVMFGLVLCCERVMLLPATNANAVDDAVFAVPEVAPPAAVVIEVNTVPTVLVATPMIVTAGLVLF